MMKGIGYIRVSTIEQAKEGLSLENQESKIKSYAKLNDISLLQIIRDEGISAKNLKREGVVQLLDIVQSKRCDAVIVYKLDRLSRSTLDILNLIETFKINHVSFHSISEKIDTETAMGKFFLTILSALAQMERDIISERTRDVLQFKKSNGYKTGGSLPYGFFADDEGKLYVNDAEMVIVDEVKKLRSDGLSYGKIAKKVNRRFGEYARGKRFYSTSISQICNSTWNEVL